MPRNKIIPKKKVDSRVLMDKLEEFYDFLHAISHPPSRTWNLIYKEFSRLFGEYFDFFHGEVEVASE